MSAHRMYSVDVRRQVTMYQRINVAIPDSIPESEHVKYIEEAVSEMEVNGDLCNAHTNDDVQDDEIEIVECTQMLGATEGKWDIPKEDTNWAYNGDEQAYVDYIVPPEED